MYLKTLEIYGFKSFAEKTVFKLEPGITAIVGPNGCGKSNVFDAIKWTLGEQSPKILRGLKMEDVIFNGSTKAEPLNYAEVTMVFSNEDKALDIDFTEVSISRRLFRSGESQYFLNKNQVRLKDIQELLSKVGLGEGSYSFIQQGRIEHIITSPPLEKRVIFDEAAGILHYKEKKRETLRRLEEAEANLERVNDIINEVKRQKDSLERQVARARKYEELFTALKEKEKVIACLKILEIKQKRDQALDELSGWEKEKEKIEESLRDYEKQLRELEDKREVLRQQQERENAALLGGEAKIESLRRQIEMNNTRIEELQQQSGSVLEMRQQYENRIKEYDHKIEDVQNYLLSLDESCRRNEEKIKEAERKIGLAQKEIKEAALRIKKMQEDVLVKENEKITIANNLVEKESYLKVVLARQRRLNAEFIKSKAEIESFLRSFEQVRGEREKVLKVQSDAAERLEALREAQIETEKILEDIRGEKIRADKEISVLESKLEMVREAEARYDSLEGGEKVKIIFEQKVPHLPSLIMAELQEENREAELTFNATAKIVRQEAEKLIQQIDESRQRIKQLNNSEEEKKVQLSKIEGDISKLNDEIDKCKRDSLQLESTFANYQENLRRLEEDKGVIEFDLQEATQEREKLESETAKIKAAYTQKEEEVNRLKDEIRQIQKYREEKITEENNLERDILEVTSENKSLKDEKVSKEANLVVFKEEKERLRSFVFRSQEEDRRRQEKIAQLREEITKLAQNIEEQQKEEKEKRRNLEKVKYEEESLIHSISDLRLRREEKQPQREEINKKITAQKIALQGLSFEETQIREALKHDYEIGLTEEDLHQGYAENINLGQLEDEREELKRKIKYLGRVNLVALEEYEELSQRYEFLNSQRNDILNSKESLQRAIYKINRVSRQMFIETLEKIQVEFRRNFRFLFGEGNAKIVVLNEDDVLDSGIDIIVQPPGKNLQSISLLSGGEKSLTAIALIFSIFKIKPSPLCVLDEIDAPLDEANIDRFNNLLEEFSAHSQFIVITHSKKTMSKASIMYGITMQKEGISQVVSVKLSESFSHPTVPK